MQHEPAPDPAQPRVALVLSGGNALGAYQAGAFQALEQQGLGLDWVAGASIGAINGAVICGNAPGDRLARLQELWRTALPAAQSAAVLAPRLDEARRTAAVLATLLGGQPGLFVPRSLYGPWWNPLGNPEPRSLYDSSELESTLTRLVDFDRLNRAMPRFSATALDLDSGEDIHFDTSRQPIGPHHLRASTALLPAFSPVEVEGRLVGDAGLSANLPLDLVLSEAGTEPLLCIAIDLVPLAGPPPRSLGDSICRAQDLVFATQSRRSIAAWQALFRARAASGPVPSITLVHLAYANAREVSGKAFDYSPGSLAMRWQAGVADMLRALDGLAALPDAEPGLTVYGLSPADQPEPGLKRIDWAMPPVLARAADQPVPNGCERTG